MKENNNIITKAEKEINYIPLVDNYYFSADVDNYTLYYFNRRNKTDRQTRKLTDEIIESYDVMGYYTSIEGLIKGCCGYFNRKEIENGNLKNLNEAVKQITDNFEKLKEMLE